MNREKITMIATAAVVATSTIVLAANTIRIKRADKKLNASTERIDDILDDMNSVN